jgi:DNA-binding NarL/FixJ family response regulator
MNSENSKLADAIEKLAFAVERQTRVLELLTEGMKPSTEAAITGVSVRTVSRRRKARRMQKLLT